MKHTPGHDIVRKCNQSTPAPSADGPAKSMAVLAVSHATPPPQSNGGQTIQTSGRRNANATLNAGAKMTPSTRPDASESGAPEISQLSGPHGAGASIGSNSGTLHAPNYRPSTNATAANAFTAKPTSHQDSLQQTHGGSTTSSLGLTAGGTRHQTSLSPAEPATHSSDDARLIAAAPDLLAALQSLEWACSGVDYMESEYASQLAQARAAIAQATGE